MMRWFLNKFLVNFFVEIRVGKKQKNATVPYYKENKKIKWTSLHDI